MNTNEDLNTKLENLTRYCASIKKLPLYKDRSEMDIFAIVSTAIKLDVDPFIALNGGFTCTKGKVEMTARLMNAKIREGKHSITKDSKSDDTVCILHGKRSDTQDTWTESFSLEDARKANLLSSPVWKNYTRDMLFARALSRLARQLFPDIIGNTYVEGEISLDPQIKDDREKQAVIIPESIEQTISEDQVYFLVDLLNKCPDYRDKVTEHLSKKGIMQLSQLSVSLMEKIVKGAENAISKIEETQHIQETSEISEISEVSETDE
jgi:hypothetical protein